MNYSFRLVAFPLGVFGVAIATVSLPAFSRQISTGNTPGALASFTNALRLIFFLSLPSALFLMVAGQAVVALLYQYGRFTPLDTVNTASALLFYSIGLFAFSSTRVSVSLFYSFKDAKTPVKISVITVAFNIAANLLLMKPLGFQGMALAASLSGCLNLTLLILALKKKTGSIDVRRLKNGFLQSLIASGGMALCLWLFQRYFSPDLFLANLTQKIWHVLLLLIVSAVSYLLFSKLLKSPELGKVMGVLKFKKSR